MNRYARPFLPALLLVGSVVVSGCSAATWAAGLQGFADGYSGVQPTTPVSPVTGSIVESQMAAEFTGWTGSTVFQLANGQIWQQSSYAYTYHYAYRPKVLIYKSGMIYKMKVDGVAGEIAVTRLK